MLHAAITIHDLTNDVLFFLGRIFIGSCGLFKIIIRYRFQMLFPKSRSGFFREYNIGVTIIVLFFCRFICQNRVALMNYSEFFRCNRFLFIWNPIWMVLLGQFEVPTFDCKRKRMISIILFKSLKYQEFVTLQSALLEKHCNIYFDGLLPCDPALIFRTDPSIRIVFWYPFRNQNSTFLHII